MNYYFIFSFIEQFVKYFLSFTYIKPFKDAANMWNFKLKEKTVKLIDLYHFSSRKSDQIHFYEPVMKLLK